MKSKLYLAGLLLSVLAIQSCTPDSNTAPTTNNDPNTCPYPIRTGSTLSYSVVSGTVTSTENWTVIGDTTAQGIPMKKVNTTRTAAGQTQVSRAAYGKVGGNYYSNLFSSGFYTPGANTSIVNSSGLTTLIGKTDQPVGHTWNETMNLETISTSSMFTTENTVTMNLAFSVVEKNGTININGTTYTNVTKVRANRTQTNRTETSVNGVTFNSSNSSYSGTTDLWFDCSRGILKTESTTTNTTPGQTSSTINSSYTIASYNF